MAKKTTTPVMKLAATCVSDAALSHANLIVDVRFDDAGRLLCTDSTGTWSVWSAPEGELVWRGTSTRDAGPLPLGYHLRLQPAGAGRLLGYAGEVDGDARYKVYPALLEVEGRAAVGIIEDDAIKAGGWRALLGGAQTLAIMSEQRVVVLDAETMARVAVWELPRLLGPAEVMRDGDVLAGHMALGCWTLEIRTGALHVLAADGGARCFAVSEAAGLAALWEVSARQRVLLCGLDGGSSRVFDPGLSGAVSSVAFGPGGDTLLVASAERELACYALSSGERRWVTRLDLHAARLAVRADGLIAAACAQRVTLVDGASGAVLRSAGPPWPQAGLSFRADGPAVHVAPAAPSAIMTRSAFEYRLDAPPRGEPLEVEAPHASAFVRRADGGAAWWCAPRQEGKKTVWALERLEWIDGAWQPVAELARDAKKRPALWLALCEGAGVLAAASETREVHVYDVETGALRHTLSGLKRPASRVAVSPDGAYVAAVNGKQVMCWPLGAGGVWAQTADMELSGVAFSPDSSTLYAIDAGPVSFRPARLHAWDAATGAPGALCELPWGGASHAIALGPDEALYIMASDTNVYRVALV
jgi:hypothetical protein